MRNRPIFIKVKEYADSHDFTIQQVANLLNFTPDELAEYAVYENSIKAALIESIQDTGDTQTLADLKTELHTWLVARFPDYVMEKDFSNKSDRRITFYLDGVEEEGEPE